MNKRPADAPHLDVVGSKKIRADNVVSSGEGLEVALKNVKKHHLKGPIVLLAGHEGEILTGKFHPSGSVLASAGADRSILFWTTRGDCDNYNTLKAAHSNTILDLAYSCDGDRLFSCAADKMVIMWDGSTGTRLKKLRNHQSYVNAVATASSDPNLMVSVADDCYVNVWDIRKRRCAMSFKDRYQLTAVSFNKTGDQVFVGGIENTVNVWDLRKEELQDKMQGHLDTITGLKLSPDGSRLLSNSMDNTLKCWNVESNAPENKLDKTFLGHQHNFEKNLLRCSWSPNGNMVAAGSADRSIYVWSYNSCDILYKLPRHRGSVNEVEFSPTEPLILSCSSDKQIYLGEIDYSLK